MTRLWFVAVGFVAVAHAWSQQRGAAQSPARAELQQRAAILAREDARPPDEQLQPILQAARTAAPDIQAVAVRALGRLERTSLVPFILPLLQSTFSVVRLEAANALGQALQQPGQSGDAAVVRQVSDALMARLTSEPDPKVRGAIFETIGRLPFASGADVRRAEGVLVAGASVLLASGGTLADTAPQVVGAVKGLEALIRLRRRVAPPSDRTLDQLRRLAVTPLPGQIPGLPAGSRFSRAESFQPAIRDRPRIQRVALTALLSAEAVDATTILNAWRAQDREVRRLALVAAGRLDDFPERRRILDEALEHEGGMLRYEAVRAYARQRGRDGCRPLRRLAVAPPLGHDDLLAIDLLGAECPDEDEEKAENVQLLTRMADALQTHIDAPWHEAAHAIVALARIAPDAARERLERFATHPIWHVRMYVARAATALATSHDAGLQQRDSRGVRLQPDLEILEALAKDDHDNVREAAIEGLVRARGHEADPIVIGQLARRDYQLVRTAALLLKGTPRGAEVLGAALAALARITAEKRDTSRDPRLALLERIAEFGSAAQAAALGDYLRDFDRPVASEVARILTAWNGQKYHAAPQPLQPPVPPDAVELEQLASTTVVLWLAPRAGGPVQPVRLRLFPSEAPVTSARFVRLARSGYYNRLTFHRVVPAFVIQGGSPGANEYVGDGPYARDELSMRPHLRGTVGISTRGRDTGDMQIFVNLVDNPRLDHGYTVFAEVDGGMDVIDEALEGAVIERVEVVGGSKDPPSRNEN